MRRLQKFVCYCFISILTITGCKKEEEPVPEDNFVGQYLLQEVLEEYDPVDPDLAEDKFLAPELFKVTKSDFFNPATGETITSYKFLFGDIFIGLSEKSDSGGTIIVGVQSCSSLDDELNSASITMMNDGSYRMNMFNCVGREVLANYSRSAILD